LWEAKWPAEREARIANFRQLRAAVDRLGLCDHLEESGIVPYAVPLAVDETRTAALVTALAERGINAGRYQFDFARCVFEPDFRPCVLVPIHSGMSGQGMDRLIDAIESEL
jgi:hypothetical protein